MSGLWLDKAIVFSAKQYAEKVRMHGLTAALESKIYKFSKGEDAP